MKLEKYENKNKKSKKIMLISIGVIVLVSISFLLYKSFARFTETVEFPIVNGKVDYFGNSDVYFAFYKGDEQLSKMPTKDNPENLEFDHAVCDNGAEVEWNDAKWAPLVINLTENKTKCSLYFDKYVPTSFADAVVRCGKRGTVATECIKKYASLDGSLINDDYDNLRFTGANPSNYVTFNNETWRIIGIIDGKLKIMRSTSIGDRVWDSNSNNTWSSSSLASYLNNEYAVSNNSMVVSGSWNVGGANSYDYTAKEFYSYEQGTKWTGKVGLITASDFGYAVGGSVRAKCLGYNLTDYYSGSCYSNDWIYSTSTVGSKNGWTMTPCSSSSNIAFLVYSAGNLSRYNVSSDYGIFPVVYLASSTRITGGNGSSVPFTLGF